MTAIRHEVKVRATPARVHEALLAADALAHWHGAAVERVGQEWRLRYPGGPTFRWKVATETPAQVSWVCTEGPGDAPGTTAMFALSALPDGRTLVEFEHGGWPHTDGNFRKCNTLWAGLLHQLARHVEPAATKGPRQ